MGGAGVDAVAAPDARAVMLEDVVEGLGLAQKEVSPKYFYDTRGSELFELITALEEYYPTRTERALLERWMPEWVEELGPAAFVELGAGSAAKSRIVLDAMEAHGTGKLYVPVDVSADFLHDTARRLREEYEDLEVEPEVADITRPLKLSADLPEPAWIALLGSTIGNFDHDQASRLLGRVARRLRPSDRFVLGADLRPGAHKTVARLEEAYNDADGVTASFNLNVLSVLNRELGADFDAGAFRHHAFYEREQDRIEMHLVSTRRQVVHIPDGGEFTFEEGESVRTEISCKYDRDAIETLFCRAGLVIDRWVQDDAGFFALVMGRRS